MAPPVTGQTIVAPPPPGFSGSSMAPVDYAPSAGADPVPVAALTLPGGYGTGSYTDFVRRPIISGQGQYAPERQMYDQSGMSSSVFTAPPSQMIGAESPTGVLLQSDPTLFDASGEYVAGARGPYGRPEPSRYGGQLMLRRAIPF